MGIVSWGLQCGDQDFPGVYARVGEHYDWIASQVCELSDSPPSYFDCPTKPYPPGSPYDPVVDVTVTVRFDNFRYETGWLLESIPDFRNVVYRPFGTYKDKMTVNEYNTMSEVVQVHSGRFYMLSILDEVRLLHSSHCQVVSTKSWSSNHTELELFCSLSLHRFSVC